MLIVLSSVNVALLSPFDAYPQKHRLRRMSEGSFAGIFHLFKKFRNFGDHAGNRRHEYSNMISMNYRHICSLN